jgi:excisionase family DNA binding protein
MSSRLEAALAELAAAIREEVAEASSAHASAPPRLLSVAEASDAAGIGRSLLYSELQAGRLRSVKVGRRRLVPEDALRSLVEGTD